MPIQVDFTLGDFLILVGVIMLLVAVILYMTLVTGKTQFYTSGVRMGH